MVEALLDEDILTVDCALRVLKFSLAHSDDRFTALVGKILPNLFSAFTNPDADSKIREKCLEIYYMCLNAVSWADGVDPDAINSALDETFNTWMSLFV